MRLHRSTSNNSVAGDGVIDQNDFNALDRNGDGVIDLDEFSASVNNKEFKSKGHYRSFTFAMIVLAVFGLQVFTRVNSERSVRAELLYCVVCRFTPLPLSSVLSGSSSSTRHCEKVFNWTL